MICLHTIWQAETLSLYQNGNQAIQVPRHRGPALSTVLCHFNVQLKKLKAKDGEEENFVCEERAGSSCPWEVVAVFLCAFVFFI